jgi:hypothetical protein
VLRLRDDPAEGGELFADERRIAVQVDVLARL